MYTANDIRNVTFTKSLGGYKTAEVDDFIDMCADTVEELTKSKDEMKKKMELLAEKIVEYRNDEDNIRTALLSAQRMGDSVLREANHKASLILEDAKIKAEKVEETAKKNIQEQIDELERMKKLVSDFKAQILGVYRDHLSLINVLPDYKEEKPAAEKPAEENAESPEAETPAAETAENAVAEEAATETLAEEVPDMPAENDDTTMSLLHLEESEEEPSGSHRFSDLKFGVDYNLADDSDEDDAFSHHRRKK